MIDSQNEICYENNKFNKLKVNENFYGPKYVIFNLHTIEICSNDYGTNIIIYKNNKQIKHFYEDIYNIKIYGNIEKNIIIIIGSDYKQDFKFKVFEF